MVPLSGCPSRDPRLSKWDCCVDDCDCFGCCCCSVDGFDREVDYEEVRRFHSSVRRRQLIDQKMLKNRMKMRRMTGP